METESLRNSWAITIRYLAASRYYLTEHLPNNDADKFWIQANEYLHHNELGLALRELYALGNDCVAPQEFWVELLGAAQSMRCTEMESVILKKLK